MQLISRHILRPAFRAVSKRSLSTESTVNAAEIAHFSRLSSEWWDERGEFAFLHQMNPVRMSFIRDKLVEIAREEQQSESVRGTSILNGLEVLDIGCGGGLLSESLARMGANTLGVDASADNIRIATLHAVGDPKLSHSLAYEHTSAEELIPRGKQYDVVCSMEVLEHVDNPSAFLKSLSSLVKPSGHLFLSTISRTPLAYFLTIAMAEGILGKVSKGTHTYSKYIKPNELVEFFQSPYNFPTPWIRPGTTSPPSRTQAEYRGMIYNPLTSKWILAPRDAWGTSECNYIFWARKPAAE